MEVGRLNAYKELRYYMINGFGSTLVFYHMICTVKDSNGGIKKYSYFHFVPITSLSYAGGKL